MFAGEMEAVLIPLKHEALCSAEMTVKGAYQAKQAVEDRINVMLREFHESTGLHITSIDLIDCRTYGGGGGFVSRAQVEML